MFLSVDTYTLNMYLGGLHENIYGDFSRGASPKNSGERPLELTKRWMLALKRLLRTL